MTPRFNERADTYAQSAVVQRELAVWLAQWLEPADALGALTTLELGAGDGLFTRYLAERASGVTAIDSAPRMVERGAVLVPQVQWQCADAWRLEPGAIQSAPVDRLYSSSLLQWCDDPVDVLNRWRLLVKPGGRMLHGFYVAPTLVEWESLSGIEPAAAWRTHEQWAEFFRAAGWQILRQDVEQRSFHFDSALSLLRFFHHTGAATPRRLGAGALRQLLAEYDRRFGDGNSGVVSTWAFCRIEASLESLPHAAAEDALQKSKICNATS